MGHVIAGVELTPLAIIPALDGEVLHAMRADSVGYHGFGEAYFSTISHRGIKAWKRHRLMTLNIVVPVGQIKFAIHDDRPKSTSYGLTGTFVLSPKRYMRLTIPPGLWMGFQGLGHELNLLLNIADMAHDPTEADRCPFDTIPFDWENVGEGDEFATRLPNAAR
jgi:dTDP-4-dehydrorhamnose 3,5-epimerase